MASPRGANPGIGTSFEASRSRAPRQDAFFVDIGAIVVAGLLALSLTPASADAPWRILSVVTVCAGFAAAAAEVRQRQRRSIQALARMASVAAVSATGIVAAATLLGAAHAPAEAASRAWLAGIACLVAVRATVRVGRGLAGPDARNSAVGRARSLSRRAACPTLIVGSGEVARKTYARLGQDRRLRMAPVGLLDAADRHVAPLLAVADAATPPVLGGTEELEDVVARYDVGQVVIAFGAGPDERIVGLVRRCWDLDVDVMVVPRLFEVDTSATATDYVGGIPLVALPAPDIDGWRIRTKYAVDRIVAAFALVCLAPLLAGIALAVRHSMGGPVLFRQDRVGHRGRTFAMLKFRTMASTPEVAGEADASWAARILGEEVTNLSAPAALAARCTRLGSFLRRTSLDELPQLINVVRGEMSLIGPRPERTQYVARFGQAVYRYDERHRVRGGLTGWAQVHGLRGETSLQDRVELDNFYIEHWSPWLDMTILWRTIRVVLMGWASPSGQEPLPGPVSSAPSRRFRRAIARCPEGDAATPAASASQVLQASVARPQDDLLPLQ